MSQMNLADVYRMFQPNPKSFTLFLAPHETFPKIDQILSFKASLNRYEQIEITPCILWDKYVLQLDFNNKN